MNADVYVNANGDLIGFNMYAYCRNNPVVHTESTGESILVPLLIGAGIGAVSKLVSDVVTSIIDNEFQLGSPSTYIGAAVGGGIGALIPGPVASGAISSMVSTTVEINLSNIYHLITGKGEYYAEEEAFYTTVTNGILGGLVGVFGTTNVANKLTEIGGKNMFLKVTTDLVTSLPGSGLSGVLNSNFGNEMPTSHRWDRTPVRIH